MRILYDDQIFTNQEYGGISRYFYELIRRYDGKALDKADLSLIISNNDYLNWKTHNGVFPFFKKQTFRGKWRVITSLNKYASIFKIKRNNFDVFHPTYFDPYFLKYLNGKPFVVTIYDMIHEKFANQFKVLDNDKTTSYNKKLLLDNAQKIIAISEATKKDIIEIYGIQGDKIKVIHLGSSMQVRENKLNSLFDSSYLLFVGNRAIYKNFDFYLNSVAEILKGMNVSLVCAGGGPFSEAEVNLINSLELTKLVRQVKINDTTLISLYQNALAFVFPSLYEGFGIPVLEAFSCNCPCLLSSGGSLPEVGGDAALYFDPQSADEIQSSLNSILNDETIRNNLIEKGKERLKMFSWNKMFDETMKLYKTIR